MSDECSRPVVSLPEVAEFARQVRHMQIEALQSILDDYGVDGDQFPPELVAPALQGLAFAWPNDQSAGFDTAREAASAAMDRLLDGLTARRAVRMPPASRT